MRFRPPREEDLKALNRLAGEAPLGLGALRFFARSGHTFLAEEGEEVKGFALAQAVWQGEGAMVLLSRLEGEDQATLEGLLRAVVKSALDTGAHTVVFHLDPEKPLHRRALEALGFGVGPKVVAAKVLRAP